MRTSQSYVILLVVTALTLFSCSGPATQPSDPLPSWNDGATKSAIIQFVNDVTEEGGEKYVKPAERIATFDNDGTLWCEQPVVQFSYVFYRIKQIYPAHPEWKGDPDFEAAIKGDMDYLVNDYMSGGKALPKLMLATHAGISLNEFNTYVKDFFNNDKHPQLDLPYTKVCYQPILELLEYLRANGFKTYICSGGGIDFMRVISEEMYGIFPENVIGSNARNVYKEVGGQWQLMKTSDRLFNNDKEGKPAGIDLHIGRIPIFSSGNVRTGGDIAMLRYCGSNSLPDFQLLINHDDDIREFAYSEKDNASLNAAKDGGWQVVSMKNDWKIIFPFK